MYMKQESIRLGVSFMTFCGDVCPVVLWYFWRCLSGGIMVFVAMFVRWYYGICGDVCRVVLWYLWRCLSGGIMVFELLFLFQWSYKFCSFSPFYTLVIEEISIEKYNNFVVFDHFIHWLLKKLVYTSIYFRQHSCYSVVMSNYPTHSFWADNVSS